MPTSATSCIDGIVPLTRRLLVVVPLVVVEGRGAVLRDADGRKDIDRLSGGRDRSSGNDEQ